MAKANTLGFFTMDMVHQVVAMKKDLDAAKKIAVDAIDAAKDAKPENAPVKEVLFTSFIIQ